LPEFETLSIAGSGYGGQPVPNTFIRQGGETAHLGIVLPGYRYSVEMPSLHFAGQILYERGADVLYVEYAYYRTDYRQQSFDEQAAWRSADVQAACNAALALRPYRNFKLVGKSLGTLAMADLLADPRFQAAKCVWQTPLLAFEALRERISQSKPPSLFIIGTADANYTPQRLAEVESATNGRSLVLPDVEHGLESPGNVSGSLEALRAIVAAMQQFLE